MNNENKYINQIETLITLLVEKDEYIDSLYERIATLEMIITELENNDTQKEITHISDDMKKFIDEYF